MNILAQWLKSLRLWCRILQILVRCQLNIILNTQQCFKDRLNLLIRLIWELCGCGLLFKWALGPKSQGRQTEGYRLSERRREKQTRADRHTGLDGQTVSISLIMSVDESYALLRVISSSHFIKKKRRCSGDVNVGIEKPCIIQTLCSHSLSWGLMFLWWWSEGY